MNSTNLMNSVRDITTVWSGVIDREMNDTTIAERWKEKMKNATVEVETREVEMNSALVDLSDLLTRVLNAIVDGGGDDDDDQ